MSQQTARSLVLFFPKIMLINLKHPNFPSHYVDVILNILTFLVTDLRPTLVTIF